MINRVVLVGRITRDPELRHTNSNIPVVSFTLAVNRNFTDQSGERQADFINCVAWRGQAENMAKYVRKGAQLGVEGRIQTGSYETEQGTRYTTDVVCDSVIFLETRNSTQDSGSSQPANKFENNNNKKNNNDDDNYDEFFETGNKVVAEDDLPF